MKDVGAPFDFDFMPDKEGLVAEEVETNARNGAKLVVHLIYTLVAVCQSVNDSTAQNKMVSSSIERKWVC